MNLAATAGRVVLEALRLDLESEAAVRDRAFRAIELGVGGFILFGGEATQVFQLIADLRAAAPYSLWIGADLERGVGQQFSGLPTLPPPAGLAAHPNPSVAAAQAGRLTGRAARDLGIDLVFAPVMDLDIEPKNPIVGSRAFSADPDLVGRLGAAWIAACQAEGVLACAKHFPGHGRTVTDSHAEIPIVNASRTELETDIKPFRQVAADVAAVMSAHVSYPALGSNLPATFSPEILEGLLRTELGFDGLIVTDAMNMSGFLDVEMGAGHPAVAALLAGCDLLLYPDDLKTAVEALQESAVRELKVHRRLSAALGRAEQAREKCKAPSKPQTGDTADITPAELALGCVAWSTERPAWMQPGESLRVLPIWDDRKQPGQPEFGAEFIDELRQAGWKVESEGEESPALVLIASTPQAWKGTANLLPEAAAAVENALSHPAGSMLIVFGHSRLARQLGGGMCVWGTEPTMERVAARAIAGTAGIAD